jgi:hypothetical protein
VRFRVSRATFAQSMMSMPISSSMPRRRCRAEDRLRPGGRY